MTRVGGNNPIPQNNNTNNVSTVRNQPAQSQTPVTNNPAPKPQAQVCKDESLTTAFKSFDFKHPLESVERLFNRKQECSPAPVQRTQAPQSQTPKSDMSPTAQMLYNAMSKYSENKATPEQMKRIAISLDKASKEFGVDPKLMLAVFAHESKFDPNAKSHTGARGLGQLTGVAIKENIRLADLGRPGYAENKAVFQATKKDRTNIENHVTTAVAYFKEMLNRNDGNVQKTLKAYGDPNVASYAKLVNQESIQMGLGKLF